MASSLLDVIKLWFKSIVENGDGSISGYVDGRESYLKFITDLKAVGYSFSTRGSRESKSNGGFAFHTLNVDAPISFFGSPFSIEKSTYFQCSQGVKYYKNKEVAVSNELTDHPVTKKKRLSIHDSRKIGCPAKMIVKCIKVYPEYVIEVNNRKSKQDMLQKLRKDLNTNKPPSTFERFVILLSAANVHTHPIELTNQNQRIHPEIVRKIHELVKNSSIISVKNIKVHLEEFVRQMFKSSNLKPDAMNSAFYPTDRVIYNHICAAILDVKKTKIDQDAIASATKKWKEDFPNDSFLFRPYTQQENNYSETLLFCHQTEWQRHMLNRYGKMCILDSTYRTTKLPLFFIIVKTNVGYCVVGSFVVQTECQEYISEALEQLKLWNPAWNPEHFMCDLSEAEVNAIESVFPSCVVYLCMFHREQAWLRWVNEAGNVTAGTSGDLLKFWRHIANANSEKELNDYLASMNSSKVWTKNPKAQLYFNNQWIPNKFRWVNAYLDKMFLAKISTNKGVESQNKILSHIYLSRSLDKTLSGILKNVIEDYLPESFRKYCRKNGQLNSEYKRYNKSIPEFLHNRPYHFVKHVLSRYSTAQTEYSASQIEKFADGLYGVQSSDQLECYIVDLGHATCPCTDFLKWRFPCKHMCAVLAYGKGSFEDLPLEYREDPYITVDLINEDKDACEELSEMNLNIHSDNVIEIMYEPQSPTEELELHNLSEIKNLQEACREKAKMLMDFSDTCTDKDILSKMFNTLDSNCDSLERTVYNNSGLNNQQLANQTHHVIFDHAYSLTPGTVSIFLIE